MTGKTHYRYFVGLPSPAGALPIVSMIFYAPAPVTDCRFAFIVMIVTGGVLSGVGALVKLWSIAFPSTSLTVSESQSLKEEPPPSPESL
jgi:hypothetical protein